MITSRSIRARGFAACVAAIATSVALFAGCTGGVSPIGLEIGSRTSFETDWHRYERMRASKAFAYAGDPRGVCVTGLAYGMESTTEAEARAIDYCEEQRLARGLSTPCELLAIDDAIVRATPTQPTASADTRAGS